MPGGQGNLGALVREFKAALAESTKALKQHSKAVGMSGGFGGADIPFGRRTPRTGAGAGGAGSLASTALALGGGSLAAGAAAAAAAADAVIRPVVQGGFENALRGGTFGGGAFTSAADLLASVPVLGELTGATQAREARGDAISQLNSELNMLARLGVSVPEDVRRARAQLALEQAGRVSVDRRINEAVVRDMQFEHFLDTGQLAPGAAINTSPIVGAIHTAFEDAGVSTFR